MDHIGMTKDEISAKARRKSAVEPGAALHGYWEFVCRDKNGNVKWRDVIHNLVVNAGLNHLLGVTLSGDTPDTTWFVGLIDDSPTVAAGDTMSSHGGWSEVTAYDETTREAWVEAGASGQQISNVASPAQFTIDTNNTAIGGAFLCGDSTKGGTAGVLMAAGAFSAGDKTLDDDDTLDVTLTISASSS